MTCVPFEPSARPAGLRRGAGLVVGLALLAGCRYQNLNAVGVVSGAPYENLNCFEPGNPEGFSFDIPACECQAGLRLRYVARTVDGRSDIHYEFVTGFRDGDPGNDVTMVARRGRGVVRLFLGRRQLPPYEESTGLDREQWELARGSFDGMWENYQPVLDDAFRICTEDRLARGDVASPAAAER